MSQTILEPKYEIGQIFVVTKPVDLQVKKGRKSESENFVAGQYVVLFDYDTDLQSYVFLTQKTGSLVYWGYIGFEETGKHYLKCAT